MPVTDLLLTNRLSRISDHYERDRSSTKQQIECEEFSIDDVSNYLESPNGMPYGRKLLYHNGCLEAIVMNWDKNNVCLPHDHGRSEGWVKVLKGTASHVVYSSKKSKPRAARHEVLKEGTLFYAPKGIVHHMANETNEELVTLHFYFPPISKMEVFDLDKSRAAVVSDDCGAWWPEVDRKLLSSRSLSVEHVTLAE